MKLKIDPTGLNNLQNRLNNIGQEAIDSLEEQVAELAMSLYARAQALAAERLKSGADEYSDSLSMTESHQGSITQYTIKLAKPALKWEEGWASFDMKPGLLDGPNATVGANGNRYNTVPFEHFFSKAPHTKAAKDVNRAIKFYGLGEIVSKSKNKA